MQLRGLSQNVIRNYRGQVLRLLKTYPAPNALDIQNYLATYLHNVPKNDADRLERRKASLHVTIKAMRSFFRYLYDNGLWNQDPTVKIRLPKLAKRERQVPTWEDVQKLITQPLDMRDQLWLQLCLDCGVRIGELAALRTDRIDFEHHRIVVLGKGAKERAIPISPSTEALLHKYLNGFKTVPEYVFPPHRIDSAEKGNPHLLTTQFNRRLRRLCKSAGIKTITPHQLRHFVATYLLEHGADIKAVSQFLGHADVVITLQTYHHVGRRQVTRMHSELGIFARETLRLKRG